MTKDIVVIPTYYRPEYLYLCLERILRNPGGEREIWLVQDRRTDDFPRYAREEEETERVCSHFSKTLNLRRIVRQPHNYPGNSFNVLEAYHAAVQTDARYVYLIEEDVLVTEDFFLWHETVQGLGDYFCSIAYRNMRNPCVRHVDDPAGYLECARDYASIGVCWRPRNLSAVVKHATAEYYSDLVGYVQRQFPNAGLPSSASEQDGLILRLAIADKRPTVWASLPRAYHIGVWGYHRRAGFRFLGTLAERVHSMREAAKTTAALLGLSSDPYNDVEAPPARVPAWTMQNMIQRLD